MKLRLHYTRTTTTAALHHATLSSCGRCDHCIHCNHSKKHNSNHLSVHQWVGSAIRDSQQPTSPTGFLFLKLSPPPCAVILAEGSLEVTSDSMDRWKAEMGRVREEKTRRRSKKRNSEERSRKVTIHSVFPMTCGSGGSTGRLAKAAGAEPCGQMRDEKLHGAVARSTFASEKAKTDIDR